MRRSVTTTWGRATARLANAASPDSAAIHVVAGRREAHGDQLQQILVVVDQQDFGILHFLPYLLKNPRDSRRPSLRGVGQRTRRTARQRDAEVAAMTETTAICPPCASTSSRAIASRAEPFDSAVGLRPAAKKGLKIDSRSSAGTPGPVSMTSITASPESARARTEIVAAGRREFHRVGNQIIHYRAQFLRIGFERRGLRVDRQAQPFRLRRELGDCTASRTSSFSSTSRTSSDAAACSAR